MISCSATSELGGLTKCCSNMIRVPATWHESATSNSCHWVVRSSGNPFFEFFWHAFHRCQTLWFISKPITNTKIISMIQSKSINSSYPSVILMVSGCCKNDYPFKDQERDIILIVPSQSKSVHPTKGPVQLMIPVSTPELWARHSRHSWHQCVETSADTPSIGCPTDGEGVPSNGTVVWGGSLLRRLFLGDMTLK